MNDFTVLGYVLIIGTVLIMFLRTYFFNVLDKIGNKEQITYWQFVFMKSYLLVAYLWVGFALFVQYYKAIPLYFEAIQSLPTGRIVNASEINATQRLISSGLLLNDLVFLVGVVVYAWYVVLGVLRKDRELSKKLGS